MPTTLPNAVPAAVHSFMFTLSPSPLDATPSTPSTRTPHAPGVVRWLGAAGMAATLALSAGCAGVLRVDSQVDSHAQWSTGANATTGTAPVAPASYVFERLPSQNSGPGADAQTELEGLAREVLASKGWQPASTPSSPVAPWRVQVSASSVTLPRAPWDDPRDSAWPRWGLSASNHGVGIGFSGLLHADMPYHQRSVSVVVRDGQTGRAVYETSAAHDGRWNTSPALWRAMLDAALSDFPLPPQGTRQVNIDIPR